MSLPTRLPELRAGEALSEREAPKGCDALVSIDGEVLFMQQSDELVVGSNVLRPCRMSDGGGAAVDAFAFIRLALS